MPPAFKGREADQFWNRRPIQSVAGGVLLGIGFLYGAFHNLSEGNFHSGNGSGATLVTRMDDPGKFWAVTAVALIAGTLSIVLTFVSFFRRRRRVRDLLFDSTAPGVRLDSASATK